MNAIFEGNENNCILSQYIFIGKEKLLHSITFLNNRMKLLYSVNVYSNRKELLRSVIGSNNQNKLLYSITA